MRGTKKRALSSWLSCALAGAVLLGAGRAGAATVESFRTPEYFAMGAAGTVATYSPLDLVNAAEAYALGYTGAGVVVGVLDDGMNGAHREFAGKSATNVCVSSYWPGTQVKYFTRNTHGTHVAGIIAAAQDGTGMHGIAFDADVAAATGKVLPESPKGSVSFATSMYDAAMETVWNKDMKVFNYSMGSTAITVADVADARRNIDVIWAKGTRGISNPDAQLWLVAAGNEGTYGPQIDCFPYLADRDTRNNILSVGNISDYAVRDAAGNISGPNGILFYSSNGALGNEERHLLAPGTNILSTAAADTTGYVIKTGTSMATPLVTGVGALVQQAFPYLTGKQIGDVLLSTANANLTQANERGLEFGSKGGILAENIYYKNSVVDKDNSDGLKTYLNNNYISRGIMLEEGFTLRMFGAVLPETLYGQGAVDAGKAVQGLGALNAQRLTNADYSAQYTVRGTAEGQAIYSVDTKGYTSEWRNDISEIRVGYLALDSSEADLKSRCNYYTNATYQAYTASVVDGELTVTKKGTYKLRDEGSEYKTYLDNIIQYYNEDVDALQSQLVGKSVGLRKTGAGTLTLSGANSYRGATIVDGGVLAVNGSIAGDAYTEGNGLLVGSGLIESNLYNFGAVRGGSVMADGLTAANNTLTIQGNLQSSGTILLAANGKVQSYLDVKGTVDGISSSTLAIDGGSNFLAEQAYTTDIVKQNGAVIANDWRKKEAWQSGMLATSYDDAAHTVTLRLKDNLNVADGAAHQGFTEMQTLYGALPSGEKEQLMPLFKLDATAAAEALQDIKGQQDYSAATTAVQNGSLLAQVVAARLNQAAAMEKVKVSVGGSMLDEAGGIGGTEVTMPLTMNHSDGFWLKYTKGWSKIGGDAKLHSSGITAGYDRQVGRKWRLGAFYSYLQGSSAAAGTGSATYDNRIGIYGGYADKAASAFVTLNYGLERTSMNRYIRHLGLNNHATYRSSVVELNGEYKYDLAYNTEKSWHLSPYLNGQLARYNQNAYQETGAGILSQHVQAMHNTYAAAGLGLELRRDYVNGTSLSLRLGGKHAFSGVNPATRFNYAGDAAHSYTNTPNQDHSFWTASVGGEADLGGRWKCSAELGLEKGNSDRHLLAGLTLRKVW